MYIPSFNKFEDRQEAVAFMQRYNCDNSIGERWFACRNPSPLPDAKQTDEKIILLSHFAKANPQSKDLIDSTALVIFKEPHAYISPKNYEKVESVPTWNYLAVHAYGKCTLLDGEENKAELLEETIKFYDADYLKQWDSLPDQYKQNMMKGIVAFQIVVDDLQAKAKLSQNRTEQERENVINALGHSDNSNEKETAEYMAALKKPEQ